MKLKGINEEELDRVLGRVFAHYLVPFELRLSIWNLSDLGKCLGCNLLYPTTNMRNCAVNKHPTCLNCIPSQFCLSLSKTPSGRTSKFLSDNLLSSLPDTLLECVADASNKRCVVTGFNKEEVYSIRNVLEDMRDEIGSTASLNSRLGIRGMKIEYVEGVFK
jgi:hypothetical protein